MSNMSVTLSGSALTGLFPHLLNAPTLAALPTTVYLGRRRPRARRQALRWQNYYTPARLSLPTSVDYYTKAADVLARMYLNDREGDCVIASKYHSAGVWAANESGISLQGTDNEVHAAYQGICGPGDNGCNIADVLDYYKNRGLKFNGNVHKIDGYVAADWTNQQETQAGIFILGSGCIGINLPADWTNNSVWDITNSRIVGGHDVALVGFDTKGVYISSWGRVYLITWRAYMSKKWLEEEYFMLSPDWYARDNIAPNGIDVAALRDDLQKIGNGTIPDIDPNMQPWENILPVAN